MRKLISLFVLAIAISAQGGATTAPDKPVTLKSLLESSPAAVRGGSSSPWTAVECKTFSQWFTDAVIVSPIDFKGRVTEVAAGDSGLRFTLQAPPLRAIGLSILKPYCIVTTDVDQMKALKKLKAGDTLHIVAHVEKPNIILVPRADYVKLEGQVAFVELHCTLVSVER